MPFSDPIKMGMSILGLGLGFYIFRLVKKKAVVVCKDKPEYDRGMCQGGTEVININLSSEEGDDDVCDNVCVKYPQLKKDVDDAISFISSSLGVISGSIIEAFKEMEKVPTKIEYKINLPRIKSFGDIARGVESGFIDKLPQSCNICSKFCTQKCMGTCTKWCPLPFGCKTLCKYTACASCDVFKGAANVFCNL